MGLLQNILQMANHQPIGQHPEKNLQNIILKRNATKMKQSSFIQMNKIQDSTGIMTIHTE